jgi:Tat protein secretion system quality control protein TatD with DNase activity
LPEDRLLVETDSPYQLDAEDYATRIATLTSSQNKSLDCQKLYNVEQSMFLKNRHNRNGLTFLNQPGYIRENLKKIAGLRGQQHSTKEMAEILVKNTLRVLGKLTK